MRKIVVPDYNDKRPHGQLSGLTPAEAYGRMVVNFKKIGEKWWKPIINESLTTRLMRV